MSHSLPLSVVNSGVTLKITSIETSKFLARTLMDLGLYIGCLLKVIQKTSYGRMIVQVGATKLALGPDVTPLIGTSEIGK